MYKGKGVLAGLDTPSDGTVELDGSVISKLSEDERAKLRAHRVGFVFQSFQLLPALTALENVMLPLELAGMETPEKRARELALIHIGRCRRSYACQHSSVA